MKKNQLHFSTPGIHSDCCPLCKKKLKAEQYTILWRDVLECLSCGNVWVIEDVKSLKPKK